MKSLFKWLTGLVMASTLVFSASAQNVKTYIPPKAIPLVPVYQEEIERTFPSIPNRAYPLALSEHESCITLTHSKCFRTDSELKTFWKNGQRREQGLGLGQITRAWRDTGEVRLDTLGSLKRLYPTDLKDVSWDNLKDHPDYQIRLILVLLRDDYKGLYMIKDEVERLKFADSAYNGGRKDALSARRVCGLTKGCDPGVWFNNVEKHCVKSKKVLYANRSACDINTHHVRDVFQTRLPKYESYLVKLASEKTND